MREIRTIRDNLVLTLDSMLEKELKQLETEVEEATREFREKINTYLRSIQGEKFELAEAKERIEAIRRVVSYAGYQLFFDGLPVRIYATQNKSQAHASIRVKQIRCPNAEGFHLARVNFPELEVGRPS